MSWYLIQTKPRQEQLARANLERQNYTVYLPFARLRRRRRGKSVTEPGPMFPSYLFIALSEGRDEWGPIRSTIGVARLVRFGESFARVPEQLIQVLKQREDSAGIQPLPERPFQVGDAVRVAEGPFEGYEAVIHARSARERTVILLKVIENYIKVQLDPKYLEPINGR
ncbi:MAG: transcription/translation regulatory transformer protein RfaH [Gammaproteobacteria bacterium]